MPNYPGAANATAPVASNLSPIVLDQGESAYVFGVLSATATQLPVNDLNVTTEAAPSGSTQASIAVCIQTEDQATAPSVTVEIHYAGAPGAGESMAVQEADTDADAFYITPSNAAYTISSFSAQNNARTDLSPTGGKFIRLLRTKGANAVACWAKITRMA